MSVAYFQFIEPGVLIDRELELVAPEERWVDDQLAGCHHPLTQQDMPLQARTTRESLLTFLRCNPRGHTVPDLLHGIAPQYTFWMRLSPGATPRPAVPMAGSISLRLADTYNIEWYLGHIGYHVLPPARGHRYAERACRLILPLARAHGFRSLWITCNPDNTPSRRTCERLGAELVEIIPVPRENPLYQQGDREKCRYRLEL